MRIGSELLAALAGVSDRAQPEQSDSLVEIPPIITPVVVLRRPIQARPVPIGSVSAPERGSFVCSVARTQPASTGAFQLDFAFPGRGIWYFYCSLSISADFSTTPSGVADVNVSLASPGGISIPRIISLWYRSSLGVAYWSDVIMLGQDGWFFRVDVGATIAAQNAGVQVCLTADRLMP